MNLLSTDHSLIIRLKGHRDMVIGLANFRKPQDITLPKLLLLPFTAGRKL